MSSGDLPLHVVARLAEVGETHGRIVHRMQGRQHTHHFKVNGAAIGGGRFRQQRVPKDTSLDVVHDVEGAADHLWVFAQRMNTRHRHGRTF